MSREPIVPFPAKLIDEAMPSLTDSEWRTLCVVVRQTLGWTDPAGGRKKRDWLSHSQLKARTGRSGSTVSLAVDGLVTRGLLDTTDRLGLRLKSPASRRKARRVYYSLCANWESRLRKPERTKETRYKNLYSPDSKSVRELLDGWG